jgi:hypothetical protein
MPDKYNLPTGGVGGTASVAATRVRSPLPPFARRAAMMGYHHVRFTAMMIKRALGHPIMNQPSPSNSDLARGLTIILPGIEASGPYVQDMYDGLAAGGVPGAIEVFYWGRAFPEGYFSNLIDLRRNRSKGTELARVILNHQDRFPKSPIHLIANSGGVGPALFAVEELPINRPIDGLVILAGAASNNYDLRPVLRRTRKGILNTYSQRDFVILNLGTRIFGTADRKFCVSCGHWGFVVPPELQEDAHLYRKLTQIKWSPEFGHRCDWWGNHGTSTSPEFVRCHVAPWITDTSRG